MHRVFHPDVKQPPKWGTPVVGGPFGLPDARLPCPHPEDALPTGLPSEPSALLAVPVKLVHLLVPVQPAPLVRSLADWPTRWPEGFDPVPARVTFE